MFAFIYSYSLVFVSGQWCPKVLVRQEKGRGLEGLPPSRDALEQHVKHAVYQGGGYMWGRATASKPVLPEPPNWGWTLGRKEQLQPHWVTLN